MHINAFMDAKITMMDVARVAGVNQATVSRALRNDPRVKEETRNRIRQIADDLGYRPNPLVSALIAERKKGVASGYGSVLAFLTAGDTSDAWRRSSSQYVFLHERIAAHAYQRGYTLEDFWLTEPDMPPQRFRQILLSRGIRGIVVCPLLWPRSRLDFDFSDFAAVAIGYSLTEPVLDHVSVDFWSMMKEIIARLTPRFQRIGFVTPGNDSKRVKHHLLGAFLSERHHSPRKLLAPLVMEGRPLKKELFLQWVRQKKPDAIIVSTHPVFLLLQSWLVEVSMRIPRDISMVCCDCHIGTDQSGIVQDLDAEAAAVVDLVTHRVERGIFGCPAKPQTILVGGNWRDGASLRL